MTNTEKAALAAANPERKAAWLKAEQRRLRKQFTMDWAKRVYGVEITNDNIADAIGCAEWGFANGR